jgi:hypothetical protein
MESKHLIIVAIAAILLAAIGCLLAWNIQTTVDEMVNESQTVPGNVSNATPDVNNTNSSDDDGWVWSDQQEDFIKDFNDSDGNEHIIFKSTGNELVFMKDGSVFLNGKNITDEWNGDFN